jgi:hypothetical protein
MAHGPAAPGATAPVPRPSVDISAALASARAIARETPQAIARRTTRPPDALATAIGRATNAHAVTETRGADGEWITTDGKRRCVTRVQLKWFEQGVPMLPLCEIRKG